MIRLLKAFLISSTLFGCGFTPTQQYPGPCSHNTVHEFVIDSQVHSLTDEWFYTYDENDNLILEERVVGGRVVDSLARYYEQDNKLVSTVDEEGHEILYYYDDFTSNTTSSAPATYSRRSASQVISCASLLHITAACFLLSCNFARASLSTPDTVISAGLTNTYRAETL